MFLYFVPDSRTPPESLRYAFESEPTVRDVFSGGPGGKSGSILFGPEWTDFAHLAGYDDQSQEWIESRNGEYWIGYRRDMRPTPTTLARRSLLSGYDVTLEDGNKWRVPVARAAAGLLDGTCALPRRYKLSDGRWTPGEVVAEYARLWQITCEWWAIIEPAFRSGTADFVVTLEQEADWCAEVLQSNYRVSSEEVALLGLLSDRAATSIMMLLIDFEGIKKKIYTQ